jgi:DNA repair ATPase RecN
VTKSNEVIAKAAQTYDAACDKVTDEGAKLISKATKTCDKTQQYLQDILNSFAKTTNNPTEGKQLASKLDELKAHIKKHEVNIDLKCESDDNLNTKAANQDEDDEDSLKYN